MHPNTTIYAQRLQLGLTLRDLADRCAQEGTPVHFTTLSAIERGIHVPRPPLRAALARVLDLDIVTDFERKAS